jgi:hypothetical protein
MQQDMEKREQKAEVAKKKETEGTCNGQNFNNCLQSCFTLKSTIDLKILSKRNQCLIDYTMMVFGSCYPSKS